ncbi:unnamed protein product [Rotaria socialis]|uniref:Mitochondrial carrier protein n=1 Tax=Rotaria socialis TaxID=392032 RepID=A0A821A1B4_9BILA|nr:unnamed protein product [Rotaria socialis]CAF4568750.1 unnamed protein product [Rotaria socialis]
MSSKTEQNFLLKEQIINASSAGLIGISCVYPLNLMRFMLQSKPVTIDKERTYKKLFNCGREIFGRHGLRGLYNGFTVNAFFITPEKTIKLVVNDYLCAKLQTKDEPLSLYQRMLAGAGAGTCQLVVTVPMELLIIRNVTTTGSGADIEITSAWRHGMENIRQKNFLGLYKGAVATWNRDVFFSMIYFPLFAYLNNRGRSLETDKVPFYHTLMSGICAGAVSAYVATPLDVIKTRIQSGDPKFKNAYNGVIDCAKKIYLNEPTKTFMNTAVLRVTSIAPMFGILQMVFYIGIGKAVLGDGESKGSV